MGNPKNPYYTTLQCTNLHSKEKITLLTLLDILALVSISKTSIKSFVNGNYAEDLEQKKLLHQ